MRLGEQEHAYLGHVGSGGDVNQVLLVFGVEFISASEFVEGAVDLFEVPRVINLQVGRSHLGFGRDGGDVFDETGGEPGELGLV